MNEERRRRRRRRLRGVKRRREGPERDRRGNEEGTESEECAREDASRWLGWVSYYWINYPSVFIECSVFLFCFSRRSATLHLFPLLLLDFLSFFPLLLSLLLLLSWRCLPAPVFDRIEKNLCSRDHDEDCIEIRPEIHGRPLQIYGTHRSSWPRGDHFGASSPSTNASQFFREIRSTCMMLRFGVFGQVSVALFQEFLLYREFRIF